MPVRERTLVAVLVALALAAVVGFAVFLKTGDAHPGPTPGAAARPQHRPGSGRTAPPVRSPRAQPRRALPARPARDAAALADELNEAQRIVEDRASGRRQLAQAGLLEQLATGILARHPATRHRTFAALTPSAKAMMHTALAAAAALAPIVTPRRSVPRGWRIVRPGSARQLLGDDRAALRATHVPWEILAAIGLTETRMGRLRGPSSAGARGPMQFLPATWALYGRGDIDSAHDAILAAARLLAANGAPRDISRALYHYNPSADYVRAVEIYARRMKSDARAFDAFYNWQVLFRRVGGLVLLPVGYPTVPARPVGDLTSRAAR
jgi:membrane-bound lytic murein transglycosylase B